MQRALLAGSLVGLLGGYYGVFIVQRGLSFLGDGLAHAAFGGVALGLLLGWTPLWVALPFTVLVSLGITLLRDRTNLGSDTAIGIFFAVSVALGVLFLGLRQDYTVDAFAYLFGSILGVAPLDLWAVAVLALVTAAAVPWTWRYFAYATFDAELARADRLPVKRHDYLLSTLIALAVVASVKVVGTVLVASFLVIPAATARLLSRTLYQMTLLSVILGVGGSALGLIVSYLIDVPSGSTIILTQALMFVLAAVSRRKAIV
nr:metal ABC transporter permease [Deinobacterium chartae]